MPPTTTYEPRPIGVGVPPQTAPFPIPGIGNDAAVPRFSNYKPPTSQQPAAPRPSTPKPTRKSSRRFVIGLLMLAMCSFGVFSLWDTFFRYIAYGIVEGHVVQLVPPWDGNLCELHVQEGERVQIGQLLVTMKNDELQQRLARLNEDLSLAEATIAAEIARLEWQSQLNQDRHQKSVAEYLAAWGELLAEQTQLEIASRHLERTRELAKQKIVVDEQVEIAYQSEFGRRQKVEKTEAAVAELRRRASISTDDDHGQRLDQLEPHVLRVSALRAEIARCEESLQKGHVKSPVNGRVVKRHYYAGDVVQQRSPMLSLLEEQSVEVAVYVTQKAVKTLQLNDTLDIKVSPRSDTIRCKVCRIEHQFQPAPRSIERHYISNERVLAVYLKPDQNLRDDPDLLLGAEAVVFRSWWPSIFAAKETKGALQ